MAQCKLTPHEFIQNAFSPLVAVMCSPLVDQICQKNNLSFTEMIQPFCKLNTEAHFRDPSGNVITVRNLRVTVQDVHFRPPQPTLARKYLNESVSLAVSDRNSSLQIGNDVIEVPASVPWFEAWRETFLQVQFPSDHEFTKHFLSCMLVVSSAESSPADTLVLMSQQLQQLQTVAPAKLPKWFCTNVLRYYVLLHDALDGNSEKAETVFDTIKNTYGTSNCFFLQMNSRPPGNVEDQSHLPDPWSQFLIRQFDGQDASDHDSSPRTPAELGGVTAMPSRITFDGSIDSGSGTVEAPNLEVGQEAGETVASTGAVTVTRHPLSPETDEDGHHSFMAGTEKVQNSANDVASVPNHINTNVWAGHTGQAVVAAHGVCLTSSDLDRLRGLVQDFCVKALLPYVERQIQQLSDLVSNKKGVSRSLLSATKRWFGSNKPGLPNLSSPANAVVYSTDAPELQLRRLGDLCFMFGHYSLAFQIYHTAKRDFNADQAWLYYAGALEMAALSAFMQGESTRKAQEYMEESIVTYLNSCKMPQFATRATLLSTECLKGRGMYGEAAQQFIRMTSEDSDLRSALLLEQASYCFLKASRPRMARKYAFHIVLAGHRFAKAGQRQHSMRCYRQAYQVYEKKCWSLAEDHIHLTTGHQAANLKQMTESAKAFAQLLTPMSRQTGAQQAVYLRDFLAIQQQLSSNEAGDTSSSLPVLPLPLVDQDSVKVLVGPLPPFAPPSPPQEGPGLVPATGVTFEDDLPDSTRWSKLEEALVTDAQGSLPMIFKPTVQMFSNRTNNTNNPISVVGEPVSVQMRLCNPLRTALPLQQLQLMWNLELQPGKVIEPRSAQAHAQCLDTLLLPPDSTQDVVLSIVPQCVGTLHILGMSYRLVSPLPEPGPLASPSVEHGTLSVTGRQVFTPRSVKQVRGGKESVVDKRLQIVITRSAPCLQVNFRGLNSEMLCGELQQVTVEFCNVGNAALTALRVATSTPALFVLHGPTSNYGSCRVSSIPLKKPLEPGHMHSVPLWLRAPDTPGSATLDMLIYYENVLTSSIPRYRIVRHSWQLSLVPGVQLVGTAQNTRSSKSSGEQRALNMVFQVKNCNQVYDPVMTEVSLVQVSVASSLWRLAEILAMPKEVRLQSQEMVHLVLKACKQHGENKDETQFSDLPLDDSNKLESVRANPFVDFFNCYLDSRNISSENPDNSIESHGAKSETLTASLLDITVILRWQACVMAGQGKKRTALGQHHLRIEGVGKPSVWPPDLTPAATAALHTQPDGPLRIFGPEAVSSQSSSSVIPYPSLDMLQKLVTYSIQHPSQIAHNFKQSRLCVVPVQMQLQNCSGQQLLVKIKTLGSNSSSSMNKNQLYSPHAACAFGWVGLAEAWLELGPHGTAAVGLMAALGAPGTFDLGSRLEVWCRKFSAPVADAITQSWRVESALIVTSAAS